LFLWTPSAFRRGLHFLFLRTPSTFRSRRLHFCFYEHLWPFAREGFIFYFFQNEDKGCRAYLASTTHAHLFFSIAWMLCADDNPPSTEVGSCFGTFSPIWVDTSLGGSLFIFYKGLHKTPASLKTSHLRWPLWPPWRFPQWGKEYGSFWIHFWYIIGKKKRKYKKEMSMSPSVIYPLAALTFSLYKILLQHQPFECPKPAGLLSWHLRH
jgi:hypothetical protein